MFFFVPLKLNTVVSGTQVSFHRVSGRVGVTLKCKWLPRSGFNVRKAGVGLTATGGCAVVPREAAI